MNNNESFWKRQSTITSLVAIFMGLWMFAIQYISKFLFATSNIPPSLMNSANEAISNIAYFSNWIGIGLLCVGFVGVIFSCLDVDIYTYIPFYSLINKEE